MSLSDQSHMSLLCLRVFFLLAVLTRLYSTGIYPHSSRSAYSVQLSCQQETELRNRKWTLCSFPSFNKLQHPVQSMCQYSTLSELPKAQFTASHEQQLKSRCLGFDPDTASYTGVGFFLECFISSTTYFSQSPCK